MSKTVPAGLATRLAQETTNLATLVKIELGNGVKYFFTSHDNDIVMSGDNYRADTGMSASSIEQTIGTSTQDFTLELVAADDGINVALVETGVCDNARITVYTVDYLNISDGALTMFVGRWGNCDYQDIPYIKVTVRSLLSQERFLSTEAFSTSCRADLGDARCGININALKISGTITGVTSKQIVTASALTQANGYWQSGMLKFTSGLNAGVACEIMSSTSAGVITTQLMFQFLPAIGDTFDIYPGCNKQLGWNDTTGDCINRYNNAVNFRGEPLIIRNVPVTLPPVVPVGAGILSLVAGGQQWRTPGQQIFRSGATTNAADVQQDGSVYGRTIPIIFGSARAPGVVVWASPKRETWGVSYTPGVGNTVTQEHVLKSSTCDFAIAFAQAGLIGNAQPATADLVRLYVNGELVLDKTDPTGLILKTGFSLRVYSGREDQLPDPNIEADIGSNKTPGYRGMIYAVFDDFDLLKYNGTVPVIEAEIAVSPNSEVPTKVFTELASYPYGTPIQDGLIIDWARNTAYDIRRADTTGTTTGNEGRAVRIWSLVQQSEVNRYVMPTGANKPSYDNGALAYSTRMRAFITNLGPVQNGMPLGVFDANTGGLLYRRESANGLTPTPTQSQLFRYYALTNGFDLIDQGPLSYNNYHTWASVSELLCYATLFNQLVFYELTRYRSLNWVGTLSPGVTVNWITDGPMTAQMFNNISSAVNPRNVDSAMLVTPVRDFVIAGGNKIFWAWVPQGGAGSYDTSLQAMSGPYNAVGLPRRYRSFQLSVAVTLGANETCKWVQVVEGWQIAAIIYDSVLDKSYLRLYGCYYTFSKQAQNDRMSAGIFSGGSLLDYWPYHNDLTDNFTLIKNVLLNSNIYINANDHGLKTSRASNGQMIFPADGAGSNLVVVNYFNGQSYRVNASGDNSVNYYNDSITYGDLTFGPCVMDADTGSFFGVSWTQFFSGGDTVLPASKPMVRLFPGKVVNGDISLGDVLLGYCVTAGYSASEVNSASITDQVHGSIINQRVSLNDLLGNVCGLFGIDVIESQGVIKFRRQSVGTTVAYDLDLTKADLVPLSSSGSGEGEHVESTRDGAASLPNEVDVKYIDYISDYQVGLQQAKRPKFPVATAKTDTIVTYSVPIAMTAAQAQYWAQKALYDFYASGVTRKFRLPPAYHRADPSDFVHINTGDREYAVRLEKVTYNGDRSLSIEARDIREDNTIPPPVIAPVTGQHLQQPGVADPLFIDSLYSNAYRRAIELYGSSPQELIADVNGGYQEAPWLPWQVEYYIMGDAYPNTSFGLAVTIQTASGALTAQTSTPAVYGRCVNSLPTNEAAKWEIDRTTQLIVKKYAGVFASATSEATFLAGEKHALVGRNGAWELVRYKTVVDNGDGTITVSGFIRACMDTRIEFAFRNAGDYFIDWDPNYTPQFLANANEVANTDGYITTVSENSPVTTPYGDTVRLGSNAVRPPLVAAVRVIRETSGDLSIYWAPNTRLPPDQWYSDDLSDSLEDQGTGTGIGYDGGWRSTDLLNGTAVGGICEVQNSAGLVIRNLGSTQTVTEGNPANLSTGTGAKATYTDNPVATNQPRTFVGVLVSLNAQPATFQWRDALKFTYAIANQTADGFTGTEGTIKLRIAQMGALYGSSGYDLNEGRSETLNYTIYKA